MQPILLLLDNCQSVYSIIRSGHLQLTLYSPQQMTCDAYCVRRPSHKRRSCSNLADFTVFSCCFHRDGRPLNRYPSFRGVTQAVLCSKFCKLILLIVRLRVPTRARSAVGDGRQSALSNGVFGAARIPRHSTPPQG